MTLTGIRRSGASKAAAAASLKRQSGVANAQRCGFRMRAFMRSITWRSRSPFSLLGRNVMPSSSDTLMVATSPAAAAHKAAAARLLQCETLGDEAAGTAPARAARSAGAVLT